MWQSKGRSGYGDTNLDGTYDDVILGVSPNGRQYRNEATLEQRDLSGWAYWNLRKQITPEQEIPEALYARNETEAMSHTLANGQANLPKYADPVVVKKPTKVPLKQRILPQASRVDKLRSEAIELELAFKAGEFTPEEYTLLRDVAFNKLRRAEVLYRKAISVKAPSYDDDYDYSPEDTAQTWEETYKVSGVYASENGDHVQGESVSWIDELSDENCFKKILQKACKAKRKFVQFSHQVKKFTQKAKAFYIRFEGV